jgi:hypothetical protein
MSLTDVVRLPAPDRDANLELIAQYVNHELPIEVVVVVDRMLAENAQFRADVLPILVLHALPIRLGELFCEEARDESPWRFKRRVKKYLRLHRTDPYLQREWNDVFKEAGEPPISIDRIRGGRWRPMLRTVVRVFAVMFALAILVLAYPAYVRARTWNRAFADSDSGRASVPGGAVLGGRVYEAGAEPRRIQLERAVVTLSPGSRLLHGKATTVGGIDGNAEIVVALRTMITMGDVSTKLYKGRYRVSHPLGGSTRLVIDSGEVEPGFTHFLTFHKPHYGTGAVVTAVARGQFTTFTAVGPDGMDLPSMTFKNLSLSAAMAAGTESKK